MNPRTTRLLLSLLLLLFLAPKFSFAQSDMKTDLGITRGRNIHLWPIVYRDKSSKEKTVSIAASVYTYKLNLKDSSFHTHLLPLYTFRKDSLHKDLRLGTLYYPSFYRYNRNDSLGLTSHKLLEIIPEIDLAEYTRSANGDYLKNNLLLFLWYKNDKVLDRSHFVFFPLYYNYRKKEDRKSFLFPVLWRRADKSKAFSETWAFPGFYVLRSQKLNQTTAFPIYYRKRAENVKSDVVFPVLWNKHRGPDHTLAVVPFYLDQRNDSAGTRTQLFSPLYWKYQKSRSGNILQRNTFFPLVFISKEDRRYAYGNGTRHLIKNNTAVFPLYWSGNRVELNNEQPFSKKRYTVFAPFWATTRVGDEAAQTTRGWVFPTLFYTKDNYRSRFALVPVLYHKRSKDKKKGFDAVFPLYWSSFKNTDHTSKQFSMLFPLYTYGKKTADGVVSKKTLGITPIFWKVHTPTVNRHFVFPVYWHRNEKDTFQQFTKDVIFPIAWSAHRYRFGSNVHDRFNMLLPLYYKSSTHYGDSLVRSSGMVTPMFWYTSSKEESIRYLFPLIYAQKKDTKLVKSKAQVLVPVFFNFDTYYKDEERQEKDLVIFPLYSKGKTYRSDTLSAKYGNITPFYGYYSSKGDKGYMVFPLLFSRERIEKGLYKKNTTLFPLYWSYHQYNSDGRKRDFTMTFPLYLNSITTNPYKGNSQTLAITPLYCKHYEPGTSSRTLFPLYFQRDVKNDTLEESSKLIFPLAYSVKTKEGSKETSEVMTVPFVYKMEIKENGKQTFAQGAYTPLYWYKRSDSITSDVVFPIFWNSIRKDDSQTVAKTTLFPVFWKSRQAFNSGLTKDNVTLFPVFYRSETHKNGELALSSGMATPLYWYKHEKRANGYVADFKLLLPIGYRSTLTYPEGKQYSGCITPLIWYSKLADDKNQGSKFTLFPIYWSREKAEIGAGKKDLKVLFPIAYRYKENDEGGTPVLKGAVTPIYWFSNYTDAVGKHQKQTLFPILWSRHLDYKSGSSRDLKLFVPLAYQSLEYDSLGNKSVSGAVTPVFWFNKYKTNTEAGSKITLFPVYWSKHSEKDGLVQDLRVVFPLAFVGTAKWNGKLVGLKAAVTPLIWFSTVGSKDGIVSKRTVFPIFWSRKSTALDGQLKKQSHVVFPLYFHHKDSVRNTVVVPPLYLSHYNKTTGISKKYFALGLYQQSTSDSVKNHHLFGPLIGWKTTPSKNSFHIFPILWNRETDTGSFFAVQPFYYARTSPTLKTRNFMWQLFSYREQVGEYDRYNVVGPLLRIARYKNQDREFRILHLLYANTKLKGTVTKSIFPVYFHKHDEEGNSSTSAGLAFYNFFKKKLDNSEHYYKEERIFWILRIRSNAAYLKSQGVVVDRKKIRAES